jgi:hypothetical protein
MSLSSQQLPQCFRTTQQPRADGQLVSKNKFLECEQVDILQAQDFRTFFKLKTLAVVGLKSCNFARRHHIYYLTNTNPREGNRQRNLACEKKKQLTEDVCANP